MLISAPDIATYAALVAAPKIGEGHDAELKFETRQYRIWVPRVTDIDAEDYGMPFCPIQIEVYMLDRSRWEFGDESDLPNVLDAARRAGLDV